MSPRKIAHPSLISKRKTGAISPNIFAAFAHKIARFAQKPARGVVLGRHANFLRDFWKPTLILREGL